MKNKSEQRASESNVRSAENEKYLRTLAQNKRAIYLDAESSRKFLALLEEHKIKLQRTEVRGSGEPFGEYVQIPDLRIVVAK